MPKVFIGSTSRDLYDYRQAAIEVCNRLGVVPVAMEFFESMGVGATEGSKRKLDEADVYVGIFAHRYGYIEEGFDKGVTEIEFDYAGERKIDRLCFLVAPSWPWPPDAIDYQNHERLQEFKARLSKKLIRSEFTSCDDFKAKVTQALVEWQKDQAAEAKPVSASTRMPTTIGSHVPPIPALLIGRENDLLVLKARLGIPTRSTRQPLTIIRGWPGVGKTTLVTALAHDPDVIKAFTDGVLWASIGENPNSYSVLASWARSLGVGDLGPSTTLEELIASVRTQLRSKQMLLIVDDVWETEAAAPFKVAGADCMTLITTRFPSVSRELATTPDQSIVLGQLTEDKALALFAALAPTVVKEYPAVSRQLVSDLEGLPLAIRVAGRMLEGESSLGFDVIPMLTELRDNSKLLEEVAPDDRFDPNTGTTPTIDLLLKQSTDRLDQETRDAFARLGAFAPKPATFDLEAMKAVWQVDDPKPLARKLADRGLLEPIIGTGRFQMHALLVMHTKSLIDQMPGLRDELERRHFDHYSRKYGNYDAN